MMTSRCPPLCVACGADADGAPLIWGFGLPGEAPGLMRVINLCETCRPFAIKAAMEASQ